MNLKALLPQLSTNAETLLLGTALHFASSNKLDTKGLDADAMAVGLFAVVNQLEAEHPGIAEKYGWARVTDVNTFTSAVLGAVNATPPDGLH